MVPTVAWPGSTVRIVDQTNALGGNISGLTFAGPSSLWAVRDGPSTLSKLDRTTSGWATTSESGAAPNAAVCRRPRGARCGSGHHRSAVTTPSSMSPPSETATNRQRAATRSCASTRRVQGALRATQQWELNAVLPATGANAGIEGLTWIPDDVFVAMGFLRCDGQALRACGLPRPRQGPLRGRPRSERVALCRRPS